ncbi:MAG: prepilin-type N-terminal cleavage/methylation domain-containing protein [Pseudomonadota bacterium]|nr:prepilin-type N-terminal cleavage/methylation domain-containing protein [Pseudomonadota bacterium]
MMNQTSSYQQGFTLVELMIASALGIFLMGAIIQVFNQSRATVTLNQSVNEIQDRGRTLLNHLAFNIKQRGYQGCLPPMSLNVDNVDAIDWANEVSVTPLAAVLADMPYAMTSLLAYEVNNAGTFAPVPATTDMQNLQNGDLDRTPRPNSDIIHVEYGDRRSVTLFSEMNTELSSIEIEGNPLGFSVGDLIMIGDCTGADIVEITSMATSGGGITTIEHAAGLNRNARLSKPYDTTARVRKFNYFTYFVADSERETVTGDTIYSLYRADHQENLVELSDGIEFLQMSYKQESAQGVQDMTADDINFDPMKVTGLELGLLITGHKNVLMNNDSKLYRLPGAIIGPNQRADYGRNKLLKTPFRTHVDIKNRA